tara:strand:- start:747 stop:1517 length:771 start_codon:yes stop_codon:yes gene_type:complete
MNDLFIGGGGYSGVMFIGALEYIHENKLLDLKNFYGCSIGSLIGCLYISGHNPKNMLSKFLELEMAQIVKYDFNNLQSENHIIDSSLLETLIGFLWENIPEEITIKNFSDKFGVNINIYSTNITKNSYVNLSNINYPDVKLKDALMASMCIPFLFKPVIINGETYVDGCCKNIFGSPPLDVYICGYSIILDYSDCGYARNLVVAMIQSNKPRSTYLIECINNLNANVYMNLDKLDKKNIIEMYKNGINYSKTALKS